MTGQLRTRGLLLASAAAIMLLALWLRNPVLPYAWSEPDASGPTLASYEENVTRSALAALSRALATSEAELRRAAVHALSAPPGEAAFVHLRRARLQPEAGVVLYDEREPVAWSGQLKVDPARMPLESAAVTLTDFYVVLSVPQRRGTRVAVASAVIAAEPPADRLVRSLVARLGQTDRISAYSFGSAADTTAGVAVPGSNGLPLLRADADPLPREMARFAKLASAQARGMIALALGILVFLGFAWRDRKLLADRLVSVGVSLAAIALVPWSNYSNVARAFDPVYYFSRVWGPLSANAGVLLLSGSLLLLGVYAIIRGQRRPLNRGLAAILAPAAALAGVWLVFEAARGINHPPWGTTAALWLMWELPLFVLLFAFWLAAIWLGRMAAGARRGVHLRTAAVVAVAAGFAAAAVTWRTSTRDRLDLAERDIAGLQQADGDVAALVRRFAAALGEHESAGGRAELLKRYAASPLAPSDLPITLSVWRGSAGPESELRLSPLSYDSAALGTLVRRASAESRPLVAHALGPQGRQMMMAVPHRDGSITAAVVSPRTQLVPSDPFAPLLGLAPVAPGDPPYILTVSDASPGAGALGRRIVWRKIGNELHGDRVIATSRGMARAHIEIDLRSWAARTQRALLVVILNVFVAGLLWALGAAAEGGFFRWLRSRGGAWLRSYRGRLTLALFTFFVVPALAFAVWSYQRLRNDDREVRELLVREALHALTERGEVAQLDAVAPPFGTPLLLYSAGFLVEASDPLLEELSPTGVALPEPVHASLGVGRELTASWQERIGRARILFGYRATTGPEGARYVVGAPARADELALNRRRRDIAVLVLFATVLGGVAAFWLSGIAAKRLARDLELSRIEVARAERVLAWGEMARQIAHEIKNPLTPIRLGVQHLRRARTDARVDFDQVLDENVTRILAEIDRLDEIARAFSRYGSAPSELAPPEPIDVAPILRDVMALERMGVGDVNWTLTGADSPAPAQSRADELRDVLLNLLENARLARARNVSVSLTRSSDEVCIELLDDGSGIPSAALERVFEPHFSTRTTGSGLGLAISRRLLESWGGSIEIANRDGSGARVVLRLRAAT